MPPGKEILKCLKNSRTTLMTRLNDNARRHQQRGRNVPLPTPTSSHAHNIPHPFISHTPRTRPAIRVIQRCRPISLVLLLQQEEEYKEGLTSSFNIRLHLLPHPLHLKGVCLTSPLEDLWAIYLPEATRWCHTHLHRHKLKQEPLPHMLRPLIT